MFKRRLIKPVFKIATRILDDTVPPEDMERFLENKIVKVKKSIDKSPFELNTKAVQEFLQAYGLCRELNLPISKLNLEQDTLSISPIIGQELQKWIAELPNGKIVGRNGIAPGSGENLLSWVDQFPNDDHLKEIMERLLRHVEVKRSVNLNINPPGNSHDEWLEKHAISIAFSIYARKSQDIRFLNTAFKLNDWAYPKHKHIAVSHQLIRYLWALAEAEVGAKELLP